MRISWAILATSFGFSFLVQGQGAAGAAIVSNQVFDLPVIREYDQQSEIGPDHRRITQVVTNAGDKFTGSAEVRTNELVLIGSGLNYWKPSANGTNGQWVASSNLIEVVEGAGTAIASHGSYQVTFPANVTDSINLTMPDQKKIRSHVAMLAYYDVRGKGSSVIIAEAQSSVAQLVPPNEIVFENAFGTVADVVYIYEFGAFHQNLLVKNLPPPEEFKLSPETCRLEIWTEIDEAPEPQKKSIILRKEMDAVKRAAVSEPDFTDEFLDFGSMQMMHGKGFFTQGGGAGAPIEPANDISIGKTWFQDSKSGRRFLIEAIEYPQMKGYLNDAAKAGKKTAALPSEKTGTVASVGRIIPAKKQRESRKVARMDVRLGGYRPSGLVLDYELLGGTTNGFTFSGSSVYLLAADFTVNSSVSIQNGAIIKFQAGKTLTVSGRVTTPSSGTAYLTSDIDICEESGLWPSAYPLWAPASTMLKLNNVEDTEVIQHLEFRHAAVGINDVSYYLNHTIRNCSFYDCAIGVQSSGAIINLHDCAFYGCASLYANFGGSPAPTYLTTVPDDYGNSINYAASIAVGSSLSGSIDYAQDIDVFKIQPNTTQNLDIFTTGSIDTYGDLFDASGQWVASDDDEAGAQNFYIRQQMLAGSTYYLRVRHYWYCSGTGSYAVNVQANTAPTISAIASQTINQDSNTGDLPFTINDAETPNGLGLIRSSNNSTLVPIGNIVLSGSGGNRTVRVTPAAGQTGSALISINVSDGWTTVSTSFTVTVLGPVNPVAFTPNGHSLIDYANGPLNVQMTSETGATVHYKIGSSGAWETTSSGSTISVDGIDGGNGVIQAYATISGRIDSATQSSPGFSFRLANPAESVAYNTGHTQGTITLSHSVSAELRYTTNGSAPTSTSTLYNGPITSATANKIYAAAFRSGYVPSGYISASVNQLPMAKVATASGVLTNDLTVNNAIDVWLLPNFGFDNCYGEAGDMSGWWEGGIRFTRDVPNPDYLGSFGGSLYGANGSLSQVPISYGRSYTLKGWFMKGVAGGPGDYAGIGNYDGAGNFISAEDGDEPNYNITYLTQPLVNGATQAYVADASIFSNFRPEYYFNLFVPLTNWQRTLALQPANQDDTLKNIYQAADYNNWPKVTSLGTGQVGLSMAYPGGTLPIGTPIAMRDAGGTFQYQLLAYAQVPATWTSYSTTFNYFRTGTEYATLLTLLWNDSSRMTGYELWEGGLNDRPNLYYTINGSSSVYSQGTVINGPLKMTLTGNGQQVIRLGQRGNNYLDAPINVKTITFKAANPVIVAAALGGGRMVSLSASSLTTGASIYYTTDGSDPGSSGTRTLYNGPVIFSAAVTTRWKAILSNFNASDLVVVDIQKLDPPTFGSLGGALGITADARAAQVKYLRATRNYLDSTTWAAGSSGSQPGFTANSQDGENQIQLGLTPNGTQENLWVGSHQGTDSGPDGGFLDYFNIDKTKTYRFSVWIKKMGGTSGYSYMGCDNVSDLNGNGSDSPHENPYFWYGNNLPLNEWCLVVGYVRGAGYTGTDSYSRVYNSKGEVIYSGVDFKWLNSSRGTVFRTFLYYCTDTNVQQAYWNPRVEEASSVPITEDLYWAAPVASPATPIVNSGDENNYLQAISYSSDPLKLASTPVSAELVADPVIRGVQGGAGVDLTVASGSTGIYYTTNGNDPTISDLLYTGPVRITAATTTKWKVIKSGYASSATVTNQVTKLAVPTISNSGGTWTISAPSGASVKYLGSRRNYLDSSTWVLNSSGSQPGFSENGLDNENGIVTGMNPYGQPDKLWMGSHAGNDSGPDGGFWTQSYTVDTSKTYRFSVWMKKTGGTSGYSYLGSDTLSYLNGSGADAPYVNPYFWYGNNLPLDEWDLVVGYVHPAGYTGTDNHSGVYNARGDLILTGWGDCKWLSTTTATYLRTFLYYCLDNNVRQYYWDPRLEEVTASPVVEDVYWAAATNSPALVSVDSTPGSYLQTVSYSSDPFVLPSNVLDTRTDSDGDGLPDWWEMQYFGNLDHGPSEDFDGDGLTNLQEFIVGTNPTMIDTDGNGVTDANEDADGDLLSNIAEFNIYHSSPVDAHSLYHAAHPPGQLTESSLVPKDGEFIAVAKVGVDQYQALLTSVTVVSGQITLTLSRGLPNEAYDIYLQSFSLGTPQRFYVGSPGQTNFLVNAAGAGGIFYAVLARDSDNDGLDDGYEALVSHTPINSQAGSGDAYGDWNGDGILNIDEFRSGVALAPTIYQPNRNAVVP